MHVTVHRGSHQIGGTCIEIAVDGARIILDAGLPLEADMERGPLMPPISGLFVPGGPPVDALFLSHAHADHSGLIAASCADVPVWMTAGTSKMLMAGNIFARQPAVPRERQRILVPGDPVRVGAFTVTALPVDHSIYDAMAFLVEAEGKRVLYTGDLRFHGRKPGMSARMVDVARAKPVDTLLIEGTRMGARENEPNLSEKQLEHQIATDLRAAPGAALAMYSPLNVDRFVTFLKAARAAGRTLVIDPYQNFVLHLIGRQCRLPRPAATGPLRVLVPPRFAASGAGSRFAHTQWAARLEHGEIQSEEIRQKPGQYLVLFRPSMQPWLFPGGLPLHATCFFSYWPGYLEDERLRAFVAKLDATGGQLLRRHASGHAHPADLRSFVEEIHPRLLIPVHTTTPETWGRCWPETTIATNGVEIAVP